MLLLVRTPTRWLRYRRTMTPDPTIATATSELPAAVGAALAATDPDAGTRTSTVAAGIPFSSIAWGEPGDRPLVLIHGVTASARIWWRVGPALAATGRRVIAVDLPGHGQTGHWAGHHRFRDNATDVAAWIRATGLDVPEVQIVGHSWGGMTAAALPLAGIRPATLVLLDPPAVPYAIISAMANDPAEQVYADVETAVVAVAAANPGWSAGDVRAKAEALAQVDVDGARAVVLDNGDWDGGLTDLSDPAVAGIPVWIVRGDPTAGGLLPDAAVAALAARIGAAHIVTLTGAPHAPQRTHAEATTAALLRALA
jgi:pimeloyl-ACP methyl ester carboxylesterase